MTFAGEWQVNRGPCVPQKTPRLPGGQLKLCRDMRLALLAPALILQVLTIAAHAADDNQRFHEEQLRRQQQFESQRQQLFDATTDAIGPPSAARPAEPLVDEHPCFVIQEIQLELVKGSRAPDTWRREFAWVIATNVNAVGRCLGQQGLNRLIRVLTDEAISRGQTTTRFTFPPQDFSKGVLHIAIAPGLISAIRFADPESTSNWKTALPLRPGDFLDLRAIEQAVEQFGRLSSIETTFDILPGTGVGESEILIKQKRSRPWRGSLSLDDAGVKATGRYNTYATATYDDMLGINDLLSVTAGSGTLIEGLGQSSNSGSLAYSVPYGYTTFSAYYSAYDYRQIVQGAFQTFARSGHTSSFELALTHVVRRTQSARSGVEIRVARKKSSQFIDDVEIDVQRRNTTSFQMGISHRQYFGEALVDGLIAIRKGGPWLGAAADAPDLPPGSPLSRYSMKIFDLSVSVPFSIAGQPLHYRGSAHGQSTDDLVLGTEFISVGGRQTVRGFDNEHALAAERGWFVRNELGLQPPVPWPEFYLALDAGKVAGPSTEMLPGTQLAGGAIGIRKTLGSFHFDLFVGAPIRQPVRFGADKITGGFQLVAGF